MLFLTANFAATPAILAADAEPFAAHGVDC
jgi:hypothetical protein